MEKQKTHVAIILDRSGSMWRTKAATVQGYNEQVQQIKEDNEDENHDIFVSLVTFNGYVTEHLWDVPADQLEEAAVEDFNPKGSTAMRDAMGHTIQKLMDTTDSDDPNTAYLICVISDGEENASKHFNADQLRELTESVQRSDRWTINYMGCSDTYLKRVAAETSVPVANCAVWANDNVADTEFAMSDYAGKLGGYFKSRARGMTATANFHSDVDGQTDNLVGKSDSGSAAVYNPPSKQEVFDQSMKNFGVADFAVQPTCTTDNVKACNNVFSKGNRVETDVWAKYESTRSTTK